jgi:hypothetical protein
MQDPAPDLQDPDRGLFEPVPSEITGDVVKDVVSRLLGGAGPGGTDAVDLKNWLLRFDAESEFLRDSLAGLAKWLANEHPPWAAYPALMACRLVALLSRSEASRHRRGLPPPDGQLPTQGSRPSGHGRGR